MRRSVVPAVITLVWSAATYVVAARHSIAVEGIGTNGSDPDAGDAVALALLLVAGSTLVLLVVSVWCDTRALVLVLWALCGAAVALGCTLLLLAFPT